MTGTPREILLRTQPNGLSFGPNIWRTKPGIPERGEHAGECSIASQITGAKFVGPVADQIEDELYVSAYKGDLAELGNFEKTGSNRLHIVSQKLRAVIESLGTKESEFIPVRVSLLAEARADPTASGGGEIVDGAYWLWNCYNWLDLVVDEQSAWENDVGCRERVRGDLPGSPVQSVHHWGSAAPTTGRRLVLRPIDYDSNPFFRIVGIEDGLFLSMAAADALEAAGLLMWEGDMHVAYTELDLLSPPQDVPAPLRVAGTDVLIPDVRSRPFALLTPRQR